MIVVISEHSMDPETGHFCRFEMEYARSRKTLEKPRFIPVVIGLQGTPELEYPYDEFEKKFCQELDHTPESIVRLTVKICNLAGKVYIPPIEAHPNLPFWKLFRKEVEDLAHSSKDHIDLMMILGEFNEYYKISGMHRALFLISYFLQSCKYKLFSYEPFYPLIAKAVCETELGKYEEALASYKEAGQIHPDDQDVIGGMGTVYFKKGEYQNAEACFEKIIQNPKNKDITNARINLAICKLAMNKPISTTEAEFLFQVDISEYSADLKTAILNARGIYLLTEKKFDALEQLCKKTIEEGLQDPVTLRLLELSYLHRGAESPE
jgi:tetratricopeptide (TPR) repeat protein